VSVLGLFALSALVAQEPRVAREEDYYTVEHLRGPDGALLEVGGLAFLKDGTLALSTRRGQVWLVHEALAPDPAAARFELFAEGLQEGLGLAVVDEHLLVLQRGELTLLFDHDGDGRCDGTRVVSNGWGLSGNYHEFAFGLPVDEQQNAYVALNVGFFEPKWWHGVSRAPWRGWVVQVRRDGSVRPFASGFRSPCGISLSPQGELFVTDNQGDWMPVGPVFHVKPGAFHGHPASLAWTDAYRRSNLVPSDTVPPDAQRAAPALWLPYKWSRSAGNVAWDTSGGSFGPFGGQMIVSELTNGLLLRGMLEKVRGEYQGAVVPLRQRIGSVVRVAFAPDGSLFCGLTNRGWGGLAPSSGLARVRWTGRVPFEMRSVHLVQDGFEIALTRPAQRGLTLTPQQVRASQYHYDWFWQYGSPERATQALEVRSVALDETRTRLRLVIPALAAGEMVRCVIEGLVAEDGEPLLHDEFAYTLNQLPEGPLCTTPIARLVPPPTGRVTQDEGWLRLCYGEAFERWHHAGWKLCDVDLDLSDPRRLHLSEGLGALANDPAVECRWESREQFGDGRYATRVLLAEGAELELLLQGRYRVRCAAPALVEGRRVLAMGAVESGTLHGAALDAWKGPGQWHELEIEFRAARLDAEGRVATPARIVELRVDDIVVQRELELAEPAPAAGASQGTPRALGPYVIRAKGPVAVGGIRIQPAADPGLDPAHTVPLFDGEDLEGWTASGAASWSVDEDGSLLGTGERGYLWTSREDYADFELTAQVKINEGGRSALWLRAVRGASEAEPPTGYALAINSSHQDTARTGSVLGLAPIATQLVGADTWARLRVLCRSAGEGVELRVWLNGVLFHELVDPKARSARGAIALEQGHAGSALEVRSISIRELAR